MPELILHDEPLDRDAIEERRMRENLALSPEQRMEKMFQLIELSLKMKNGPLKRPTGKGILLKRSK